MPSTFLALNVHIVFGTKHRRPLIRDDWRPRLHAYLGGCLKTLDTIPLEIGGISDHVHILAGIRATHRIADLLREIKSEASSWVHDELNVRDFAWQEGYAGFSVSPSSVDGVRRYIRNQEDHHRQSTFEEEYRKLLTEAGIEFDERYFL
ncbi:MAG: IS200/IS605 family transposase [Thermoanaerobaculia bacterium]